MAWDTMAVLMAGYESSGRDSVFVDISEYTRGLEFGEERGLTPRASEPSFSSCSVGLARDYDRGESEIQRC